MATLRSMREYGVGGTRIVHAERFAPGTHLYVKLEQENATGSIKDRAAYFIVQELLRSPSWHRTTHLVDATSGNFGISLQYFAHVFNRRVCCIVDSTLSKAKEERLREAGVELEFVSWSGDTRRLAKQARAKERGMHPTYLWTNQHGSAANVLAHELTTGPEIWEQTGGRIATLICAVATGGTICGTARALKARSAAIEVVGVEAIDGATFGETASINDPAKDGPSMILRKFGELIDGYARVDKDVAINTALEFAAAEGVGVGITSGIALAVAKTVCAARPHDVVVVISPDGADGYPDLLVKRDFSYPSDTHVTSADAWHCALCS